VWEGWWIGQLPGNFQSYCLTWLDEFLFKYRGTKTTEHLEGSGRADAWSLLKEVRILPFLIPETGWPQSKSKARVSGKR
jgi:hypothetical protein